MLGLIIFFIPVTSVFASCSHGTSLYSRDDGPVPVSTFSYTGTSGPIDWGGLNPANCACDQGKLQSPIDLTAQIPKARLAPSMSIPGVDEAELMNLGSTLEVVLHTGSTTFDGVEYAVKQFHLHTPSEHRIEEEYFPMEMHMVHQAANGSILVIGLLFQMSDTATTGLIMSLTHNLAKVTQPGQSTTTGPLDFNLIATILTRQPVYHYVGSLTTPPCTQGVTFLILANPLPLDVAAYNALKRILKFNSRYTQNTPGKENLLAVANRIAKAQKGARKVYISRIIGT
ncbi:alpha carbonic anhydrase [Mycena metata]|uniref:Carbonic anhydrase n=1 Tax=Mycena metata TaxID=1033252 RepID=A0AAD7MHW0_9AGAR|nr:alpha carbonic anhydrase [Mycena metata]